MVIKNSKTEDIDRIFELYDHATKFMKSRGVVSWPQFERSMVLKEIDDSLQWKIVIEEQIACVWATAFSDPQIWEERDQDSAIYIHRIATNPEFKGKNLVNQIVLWAREYCIENSIDYIRLDTVGNNTGLINYYQKCGFNFLGFNKLKDISGLPEHYQKDDVCLFQIEV